MNPSARLRRGAVLLALPAVGSSGAADGGGPVPAAWPRALGDTPVSRTIQVTGTRDGKMIRFHGCPGPARTPRLRSEASGAGPLATSGQDENQQPLFELADGATLENVILGSSAADGVHCLGRCILRNV